MVFELKGSICKADNCRSYSYSKTSIARTLMARLLWIIRTPFCPYEILPIGPENKYLGKCSNFIMKLCCVYSLELPHRGNSNEYTQHTFIV